MTTTKMLGVWYPNNVVCKTGRQELVEVDDVNIIKNKFSEILFHNKANYILVNYNDKMYIIEPVDHQKLTYTRRSIQYHPLSARLK